MDPTAAQDEAALARPIRRWFWPLAILTALLTVVLIPFYNASNIEGLSGIRNSGPGGNLLGDTYMPVLPLIILGLLILVWNPLWRWLAPMLAGLAQRLEIKAASLEAKAPGLRSGGIFRIRPRYLLLLVKWLSVKLSSLGVGGFARMVGGGIFRIRPRELLLLVVTLYAVISVSQISHLRSLFLVDDLAKKAKKNDTYKVFNEQYTRNLSFPSVKEARAAKPPNKSAVLLNQGLQDRNQATLRNEQDVRLDQISKADLAKMKWHSLMDPVESQGGGTMDSPFKVALKPVLFSSLLLICAVAIVLGLTAMTARQWSRHERLQYPLTQVPMTLVRPSLLKDRGFQVSLGLMLFISLYNFGKGWGWHPLPALPIGLDTGQEVVLMKELWKLFGLKMPSAAKWIYETWWGALHISPLAIGLAFLIPLDLGFSLWGGFFFGAMIFGWLYAVGIDVNFQHHASSVGGGATLAMAVVVLWIGRHHYLRLLRAAFGAGGPGSADRAGVWGVRLILLGGVVLCLLLMLLMNGLDPWSASSYGRSFVTLGAKPLFSTAGAALLSILIFGAFIIVIARIIAETGMANMQLPLQMHQTMFIMGMPYLFPVHVMALMSWLGSTIALDSRTNAAGYLIQATVMGEKAAVPKRRLFPLFAGLMVFAIVVGIFSTIIATWVLPGDAANHQALGGMRGDEMVGIYENASKGLDDGNAFTGMARSRGDGFLKVFFTFLGNLTCSTNAPKIKAFLVGILLIFGCYGARRIWVNFPLNPLGIVLAASWPMHQLWGSVLVGWFAKKLILRYGGSQLYAKIKPVAIGLIFGDIFGMGLTIVIKSLLFYL